jgi:hypothetical protein
MKLPKLERPQSYAGLYVFDFGDHAGVGFTAQEVAELLESEKFKDGKVYKIHKAYPDGKLELKGVPAQTFQVEAGMFFHSQSEGQARDDYRRLINLAVTGRPPCKAKVHLARYPDHSFVTAVVYPAEYDDEVSSWLLAGHYWAAGAAEANGAAAPSTGRSASLFRATMPRNCWRPCRTRTPTGPWPGPSPLRASTPT